MNENNDLIIDELMIERSNPTPPPESMYSSVCVDCYYKGIVETMYGPKPQVQLAWEINHIRDDGKRHVVYKTYTKSLGPKSKLQKDLTKWLGGQLPNKFNLGELVGKPARLIIVHNPSKDGSRVFANVDAILPATDTKLEPSGHFVRMKDRVIEKCIDSSLLK
jgi:hypothetical protein